MPTGYLSCLNQTPKYAMLVKETNILVLNDSKGASNMRNTPRIIAVGILLACVILCSGCGRQTPGTITGSVVYQSLTGNQAPMPLPDVLVVLCRVPEGGLPEGPAIGSLNRLDQDLICTLQGSPTALTDPSGTFRMENVDPATYLVMFHLFPTEMDEVSWDGILVPEAGFNGEDMVVHPSGESDFWETGGPAFALANWSASEGMNISRGNVCSNTLGFCFSILDEQATPVITVLSDETVDVVLTAQFLASE